MHSNLTPRASDDPHDIVVVAPDAIRVAPSDDEELSNLLREAARHRSDAHRAVPDSPAGPTVPPVDTTFRPTAIDVTGPSMARRLARGFAALLLAACIGSAAVAWKAYGDVALKQAAKVATQLVLITSMQRQEPASATQPAPPADQADVASTAPAAQPAAETAAPAAVVPSTDPAPLQPTTRDLASLTQQVEQLKASIEQLRASQQQMSRDLAKTSEMKASEAKSAEVKPSEARVPEQNLRPKIPAPPPRRVAARRPLPSYPPPQAAIAAAPPPPAAPYVPQVAAPYVPRQPDYAVRSPEPPPLTAGEALTDPELSSVPRPPMPVR